ncbi:MAG: translation elongation factor Ts [Phycisphaerae bacterium]|nr:translation elongation factor Ts [Phycisphaerae bacterium]
MAEITAAMVKSLRERSGLPMMDCKAALQEVGGDEAAAMELLRKRGALAAEKKAGRETAEGRIGAFVDREKGAGSLVELQCETAPVANNPDFKELAAKIAKQVAVTGCTDVAGLAATKCVDDPGQTVQDLLHDVLNRLRENMKIASAIRATGHVATYVHHTGKLGVMIVAEGNVQDEALLNDVCMHIAFAQPDALNREQVPADLVAKEQEIAREQIKASGKPENMIEKILTGKMNRWFSERVLLEQAFVKDDKKTVGEVLQAAGVTLKSYHRLAVGSN